MSNFLEPKGEEIAHPILKEEGAGGMDFLSLRTASPGPGSGRSGEWSQIPELLVQTARAVGGCGGRLQQWQLLSGCRRVGESRPLFPPWALSSGLWPLQELLHSGFPSRSSGEAAFGMCPSRKQQSGARP